MTLSGSGPMLKLTVLGDGGVGKTALVIQLCLNKFVETYDPTIEDSYRTRIVLDEHAITLELMDTAGQEEYVSLRDQWIREGEGFLIVYSVTDKQSFTRIKQYFQEIKRIKDEEPYGVVLVGNKIDEELRQVSTSEGEQLASRWGIPFFETSAKKNINAESAFMALARITRDLRAAAAVSIPSFADDIHSDDPLNPQLTPQLNSPRESQRNPQMSPHLNQQLNPQLNQQLNSQLSPQLNPQLSSQVNPQVNPQLNSQTNPQLNPQLNQLNPQLNSQLSSQVNPQINSQGNPKLKEPQLHAQHGQQHNPSAPGESERDRRKKRKSKSKCIVM